ncbi:peptidoglycan DD-metalloendopeptidase family protein [Microvirga pudoricolor]|uniref:peptidoglycan DD-metalloendopeptidase family protein n=1 Tax=Microvirga pudoricolor TaxID=2778729 RepID=UPI00194F16B9|nr:peptidoglycan DD-metalloendopeptidase family protein [Microvirga pudoricolor]MBM6596128.1 peptidoglycan DD-metalloendopeptidase family protein [Microvirga pudoricolor]
MSLIGSAAAACSTDTMRFAESPFSNPFAASERVQEPDTTASTQPSAPIYPSAPIQSQALPPVQSAPLSVASGPAPSSGHGASGTSVTVGSNDTLNTISQRYGVSPNAILAASGLNSPAQVRPGTTVVIPVYGAAGPAAAPTRVASTAPVQVPAQPAPQPQPKFRLVEGSKPTAPVRTATAEPAQVLQAPATRTRPGMAPAPVAATLAPPPVAQPLKPAPVAQPQKPAQVQVASASPEPLVSAPRPLEPQKMAIQPQPVKPAVQAQPAAPAAQPETAKAPEPAPVAAASADEFRWPARGRVIAGFGANGGNEGINIAVPEGTPVKAAESGTVTYAGSEVKGYGNLVLIRHENGFVSAYAHNGSLNVKRGETVKRGQVIATSGQTGNVTSPQLHFELRKGSTPVDPVPHLGG